MTAGQELKSKDIALVCGYCWDEARTRNANVPPMARGKKARLTAVEQHNLIHHAVHEIQATQERAQARWPVGLGSNATSHMRWDFDGDTKSLRFSKDGTVVVGDVQMVGSYSTTSRTFQWSWETYGDPDHPLTSKVSDLEGFGVVRGMKRLTTPSWTCEEQEGWEMTALAGYLVGCDAIYRAPFSNGLHWFMLLSSMRFVS